MQPGDLRFPGLPVGKEEHPLGLTGLVNLSKLDFLLGRGMDREQKRKEKDRVRECQRWEVEME